MVGLFWQVQRLDEKGFLLEEKANRSKSFVKNFMSLLYRQLGQTTVVVNDIDGNVRSVSAGCYSMRILSQIAQGSLVVGNDGSPVLDAPGRRSGIVVGTGTTTVTLTDDVLDIEIEHGVGSGELEYFGSNITDVVVDGSDSYFDIERIFRNSSGSSITIKEMGLYVISGTSETTSYTHMIIRDVLDPGDYITITDGEYIRVVYRIMVTT